MSLLLIALLPAMALSQSISIIGVFNDASCSASSPYNSDPGFVMNAVLTFGQCNILPTLSGLGGGSMQVTYNSASQTFGVMGYLGTTCSGSPMVGGSSIPIRTCTMVSNNMYVLLSTAMMVGDVFVGTTCGAVGTGMSPVKNTLNAVGVPGGPGACTSSGTGSILITGQTSGLYTAAIYSALGCSGTPISTLTNIPAFDPTATSTTTACTTSSGGSVGLSLLSYTGYVAAAATPSPTPTVAPAAVSTTPTTPPSTTTSSAITLLGVYSDTACTTAAFPLNAVATVGACGGLTGLGSGFITKGSIANTYNIVGYQGVTSCTGTAAVTWSNTPIGVCTPAVGNPALNLLLAPTVIITNVYLGASATCTGKGELTAPIVAGTAPVGASPVCTNADTYSVSVVAVAGGGYTIQAFGAPNCASAALGATWTKAALNSCVPASSGGLTIFVGSQGTVPFTPSSASSTTSTPSALELGLGIGLGVGIPVVVALVFLARCYLCTVKAPAPPAPAAPAGLEKPTEVVIRTT